MDNPSGSGSEGGRSSVFTRLGSERSGEFSEYKRYTGPRDKGPSHERSSWHKVTVNVCMRVFGLVRSITVLIINFCQIIRGGSQSREWLMRSLKESINEPFMAVQVSVCTTISLITFIPNVVFALRMRGSLLVVPP